MHSTESAALAADVSPREPTRLVVVPDLPAPPLARFSRENVRRHVAEPVPDRSLERFFATLPDPIRQRVLAEPGETLEARLRAWIDWQHRRATPNWDRRWAAPLKKWIEASLEPGWGGNVTGAELADAAAAELRRLGLCVPALHKLHLGINELVLRTFGRRQSRSVPHPVSGRQVRGWRRLKWKTPGPPGAVGQAVSGGESDDGRTLLRTARTAFFQPSRVCVPGCSLIHSRER